MGSQEGSLRVALVEALGVILDWDMRWEELRVTVMWLGGSTGIRY